MNIETTSRDFFEQKYLKNADPWSFASSSYEQCRYDAIFRSLNHRRYRHGFEPGCSIGLLTERLASVCQYVDAMDISPTAVRYARERCRGLLNVDIECGALPDLIPIGSFDLVVLSEIGYYFDEEELERLAKNILAQMSISGVLVATHWLGVSEDHLLSGERVHEILGSLQGLVHEHAEHHAGFRLDRWKRI
jgi:SAM-dependent methyltransferase